MLLATNRLLLIKFLNLYGNDIQILSIVMEFANNGDLAYRIEEKIKKNTLFEEN
jgi:hypothetical protein